MMDLDWPKFSAYQMRSMQSEPTPTPKPVGGNPRIMQFTQPSFGQGVGGAVYQAPQPTPRSLPPMMGGGAAPAPNGWMANYMASGGVLPPEAPKPTVNMSAMRGAPASTIGYSMGQAASAAPDPVAARMASSPMNVGTPAEAAGVAGALGSFKNFVGAPSLGTALRGSVPLYVAGKAASQAIGGIADVIQDRPNPILQASIPARRDTYEAMRSGNYGRALGSGVRAMGQTAGAMASDMLSPFKSFVGGVAGGITGTPANPITMDAEGNFSRAPTNMAEYKQMMDLKPKATMATASELGIQQPAASASPAAAAAPAQSYNDWLMKQPVSKLNSADYANRVNLEIEKRAPELLQQNIMKAASYDLAHPDMVTSETRHKDGSWSKTYGDRGQAAMSGYSSFRNALANEGYKDALAQSSMIKANNSDKFDAGDKLSMVGAAQQRVMDALLGDNSITPQARLQRARAYFPTFQAALKANGMEPPDFDTFLQEQFGVTKNASGGYYNVPK